MKDFLTVLRAANLERQRQWLVGGDNFVPNAFRALEVVGEAGELANVLKKLEREAHGWRGSRATRQDLSDELGDVLISLDLLMADAALDFHVSPTDVWSGVDPLTVMLMLARQVGDMAEDAAFGRELRQGSTILSLLTCLAERHGLKLDQCAAQKFNATSRKVGLPVLIGDDGKPAPVHASERDFAETIDREHPKQRPWPRDGEGKPLADPSEFGGGLR